MSRRVTIMDIAKRAGVSPASVSNVINGIDKVSGATRENILHVMQELNYQPSLVARSLGQASLGYARAVAAHNRGRQQRKPSAS